MDIKEFLNQLNAMSPESQIQKINNFLKEASLSQIQEVKDSLYARNQLWLKNILDLYVDSFEITENKTEEDGHKKSENTSLENISDDEAYNVEEIRSQAVAESIGQIIHELDPLIGSLEVAANKDVINYDDSSVKGEIIRLQELVDTFTAWKKSEETPNYKNLIIYNIVLDEVNRTGQQENFKFIINIPPDLDFEVDNFMLRTIISNALRNAIESHKSVLGRVASMILINAGTLANENLWISIVDEGIGLPVNQSKLFKSRYTTKHGSRGFGLTIVAKSIKSMKGIWDLKNSSPYGAIFYFEIPRRGIGK